MILRFGMDQDHTRLWSVAIAGPPAHLILLPPQVTSGLNFSLVNNISSLCHIDQIIDCLRLRSIARAGLSIERHKVGSL